MSEVQKTYYFLFLYFSFSRQGFFCVLLAVPTTSSLEQASFQFIDYPAFVLEVKDGCHHAWHLKLVLSQGITM